MRLRDGLRRPRLTIMGGLGRGLRLRGGRIVELNHRNNPVVDGDAESRGRERLDVAHDLLGGPFGGGYDVDLGRHVAAYDPSAPYSWNPEKVLFELREMCAWHAVTLPYSWKFLPK